MKNIIVNTCTVCILLNANFQWKYNILPFEKCAEHEQKFMKLDNFVPFGRPQSGTIIIQLMTELDVSNYYILEQQYRNRLEIKAMR